MTDLIIDSTFPQHYKLELMKHTLRDDFQRGFVSLVNFMIFHAKHRQGFEGRYSTESPKEIDIISGWNLSGKKEGTPFILVLAESRFITVTGSGDPSSWYEEPTEYRWLSPNEFCRVAGKESNHVV